MRKFIVLIIALLTSLPAMAESRCKIIEQKNIKNLPVQAISEFIDFFVYQQSGVPAVMIGVAVDNEKAVFSCGTIDNKKNILPGLKTLWPLGSVSKIMTTQLFAKMINQNKVELNSTIDKLLGIENGKNKITLLHLATHSSGLPRSLPTLKTDDGYQINFPYDMDKFKSWYKDAKLEIEPGTHYQYSNIGYGLLGQLLAQVEGVSFGELLKREFEDHLGMKDTTVLPTKEQKDRQVKSYWVNNDLIKSDWEFRFERPSGGVYSTMEDMLILLDYTIGNVHKKESIPNNYVSYAGYISQDSFDNPLSFGNDAMALGWSIEYPDMGLPQMLTKNGWVNGVNCYVKVAPSKKIALVSFTNKPYLNIEQDLNRIVGMILKSTKK